MTTTGLAQHTKFSPTHPKTRRSRRNESPVGLARCGENRPRSCRNLALWSAGTTIALCGPIHDAVRKGDEAKVVALLKENPDLVSSRDKLGNTPLHIAAIHDQPAIAALLIANGADVNVFNNPSGHEVVASKYFSQKPDADFNQKAYGETPLTLALLSYHHKEMIELLLDPWRGPERIRAYRRHSAAARH